MRLFSGRPESEATDTELPRHGAAVPLAGRQRHARHHEDAGPRAQPAVHAAAHRRHHERVLFSGHAGQLIRYSEGKHLYANLAALVFRVP